MAGADGEIRELTTLDEFAAAIAGGDVIVITDSAKPAKLHPTGGRCQWVNEGNFTGKVIAGAGKNGRYYTTPSEATARERWPRLTICGGCG